ncbi:hypothetical protein K443DRAFT_101164, partial [Laccaria amethystina LaAM-08-1]
FRSSRYWLVRNIARLLLSGTRPVEKVRRHISSVACVIRLDDRYADSGLNTHLINGGKYASGIVSYLFYFLWRHHGQPFSNRDIFFILWCLFTSCSSIYSATWDLLMDWSLLRLHSPYPLLRSELIYSNHISVRGHFISFGRS